ncbi:MAG TPA: UDP-N-acetylmuramate dehydrogenase [Nocardioidaceae bacterium]|nr:UDP-N-acetylmuramate dehydrogenase [Nocardioidaceae bacterium]
MLTTTGRRLSELTTLRVGGPAGAYAEATSRADLYDAVAAADATRQPVLVLGGGSNVVVSDEGIPGLVVRVATRGVIEGGDSCGGAEVVVEAGEDWDALVARAIEAEWIGVEALSGIPGTVGAVPIQNVGAYGQEVSETIAQVQVYDRVDRRIRTMAAAECGFGYRTSVFKQTPGRYVVGAVTFQFKLGDLGAPVQYAELARSLDLDVGERAPARKVREAVLALRTRKGMVLDPADHDTWSAGSFFTNPFVEPSALPDGAPAFPQPDGTVKTSAAWLIERSGFARGHGDGPVRLSTKHTLALTNRGGATTDELLSLAREIRAGVLDTFGITLEPEPTLIGCSI